MATVPPGFALCSASFQLSGLRRKPAITMGVRFNAHPVASFVNTVWRECLSQVGGPAPFEPANMDNSWEIIETKVLLNNAGTLFSDTNPTPVLGTNSSLSNPSANVSVVIAKITSLAGVQFRGRMFAPPAGIDEADVSSTGIIAVGIVATQQIVWNHVYNNFVSNGLDPVLLHEPPKVGATPAPTDINSLRVTPLVGTNRRRIR